jgi:hypothetical protein
LNYYAFDLIINEQYQEIFPLLSIINMLLLIWPKSEKNWSVLYRILGKLRWGYLSIMPYNQQLIYYSNSKLIQFVCCRIKDYKNRKMGKDTITHEVLSNEYLSHWNFNDQKFLISGFVSIRLGLAEYSFIEVFCDIGLLHSQLILGWKFSQ